MASASMTSDTNYWYFTINPNVSGYTQYYLNTSGLLADKHIQIKINCPSASIGSGSIYKQVTSAGWANKKTGSNSGTSYTISGNLYNGLKFYNGGDYAYFTYSCKGYLLSNRITIKTYSVYNTNYDSPSGYVPKPSGYSYVYMCKATYDSGGPAASCIDGLVRDGNTWKVVMPSSPYTHCYVYVRANGSNKADIGDGDTFSYSRTDGSTWHSGYYTRTPGGSTWHSGYTSYWTRWDVYKNGQNIYSNYSYEPHFYAYVNGSSYGNVTYVCR